MNSAWFYACGFACGWLAGVFFGYRHGRDDQAREDERKVADAEAACEFLREQNGLGRWQR